MYTFHKGIGAMWNTNSLVQDTLYTYISKVKLAIIVEGNTKAPFSIATTPKCRGGHNSFSWIAPLYPWYVPYNAEC